MRVIKLTKPSRNKTNLITLSVPPEKVEEIRQKIKDIAVELLTEGLKKGKIRGSGITGLDLFVAVTVKSVEIDWFGEGQDEDVEGDTIDVLVTRRLPIEEYRKAVDTYYRHKQKEREKLIQNKDRLIKSVDKEI